MSRRDAPGRLIPLEHDDGIDLLREDGYVVAVNLATYDARRLAACWNACEGMPVEHIEALIGIGTVGNLLNSLRADLGAVILERDIAKHELAAARALLREVMAEGGTITKSMDDRVRNYLDVVDTLEGGT